MTENTPTTTGTTCNAQYSVPTFEDRLVQQMLHDMEQLKKIGKRLDEILEEDHPRPQPPEPMDAQDGRVPPREGPPRRKVSRWRAAWESPLDSSALLFLMLVASFLMGVVVASVGHVLQ